MDVLAWRRAIGSSLVAAVSLGGCTALDFSVGALSGDDDAPAVFEALTRALRLRQGDLSTAARVCDFYLRRRPWLQEYRELATAALRDLIHGATTSGFLPKQRPHKLPPRRASSQGLAVERFFSV